MTRRKKKKRHIFMRRWFTNILPKDNTNILREFTIPVLIRRFEIVVPLRLCAK